MTDLPPITGGDVSKGVPPVALDSERAVLGIILLGTEDPSWVLRNLESWDFYDYRHRWIYRSISVVIQYQKKSPDIFNVSKTLRDLKVLDKAGGLSYLEHLITEAQSGEKELRAHTEEMLKLATARHRLPGRRKI